MSYNIGDADQTSCHSTELPSILPNIVQDDILKLKIQLGGGVLLSGTNLVFEKPQVDHVGLFLNGDRCMVQDLRQLRTQKKNPIFHLMSLKSTCTCCNHSLPNGYLMKMCQGRRLRKVAPEFFWMYFFGNRSLSCSLSFYAGGDGLSKQAFYASYYERLQRAFTAENHTSFYPHNRTDSHGFHFVSSKYSMTEDVLIGFSMGECNFIAAGIFTSNYPRSKIYLDVLEITLVIPLVVLFCKDSYRNHEINTCSFSSLLLMLEGAELLLGWKYLQVLDKEKEYQEL
ncbi:hypothetical protein BDF21DRAFT_449879 [Thamnidium elegans]|nr:hypothetical protein BDF21DRAFT_449879 [Thamnidium elegans]